MFLTQVKVNKNNYTLTFSGHVGVGGQALNESFTQSMSESMERNQQKHLQGKQDKTFDKSNFLNVFNLHF